MKNDNQKTHNSKGMRAIATAALLLMLALTGAAGTALGAAAVSDQLIARDDCLSTAVGAQVVRDTLYVLTADQKLLAVCQPQAEPETVLDLAAAFGPAPDPWAGYDVGQTKARPAYYQQELDAAKVSGAALSDLYLIADDDSDTLFVLAVSTGDLFALADKRLQRVVRLNLPGRGEDETGAGYAVLDHPVAQGDFLFLLARNPDSMAATLYRFSMTGGEGRALPVNGLSLREISRYTDGQLLAVDDDSASLVTVNGITGAVSEPLVTFADYGDGAAVYNAENGQLYFIHGTGLMQWDSQNSVTVDYVPFNGAVSVVWSGMWHGLYTVLNPSAGLYTCAVTPGQSKSRPLTLWYEPNSFAETELVDRFMRRYPDTPVVARGAEGASALDQLATAVVTGDSSVDIYLMYSVQDDSGEIFRRGYASPLNSEALKADVLSMYPQLRDYLMRDGTVCGYPVYLSPSLLTVRPALLDEAELGGVPETVDAYLDMLLRWYEENAGASPGYTFDGSRTVREQWDNAVYLLLSQYIYANAGSGDMLSFNTPAFRSALEKLAPLARWKENMAARDAGAEAACERSVFNFNPADPLSQGDASDSEGEQYILPPVFAPGDQPVIEGALAYFVVNPNSRNKEAAIRFLEFYSENRYFTGKYMLYPEHNGLVERPAYSFAAESLQQELERCRRGIAQLQAIDAKLEENGAEARNGAEIRALEDALADAETAQTLEEQNRWEVSPEQLAEYRRLAPCINLNRRALVWQIVSDMDAPSILLRYLEGGVSIDQALNELDNRVAMMYYETAGAHSAE